MKVYSIKITLERGNNFKELMYFKQDGDIKINEKTSLNTLYLTIILITHT